MCLTLPMAQDEFRHNRRLGDSAATNKEVSLSARRMRRGSASLAQPDGSQFKAWQGRKRENWEEKKPRKMIRQNWAVAGISAMRLVILSTILCKSTGDGMSRGHINLLLIRFLGAELQMWAFQHSAFSRKKEPWQFSEGLRDWPKTTCVCILISSKSG